jgi:hypothetical protein
MEEVYGQTIDGLRQTDGKQRNLLIDKTDYPQPVIDNTHQHIEHFSRQKGHNVP